jgi:DNA-binding FadR family transcriptional regulator
MFTPVRTRKTFEEAVEQIADAIRLGDYRAGDRLPSERVLAAQMEISRPTLREAIKILADAGVIEVRRTGAGMVVRSEIIPVELVNERSELRIGEVAAVLEARRLLEPRVAHLAALYATEDDFDAMGRAIELQRKFSEDREQFIRLDSRFHLAMARATKNPVIVSLMNTLHRQLDIARDMSLRRPHEPELAIAVHERTMRAVMSGDAAEIEAALDEHMSFLERLWEEESGRPRLRRPPGFLLPLGER